MTPLSVLLPFLLQHLDAFPENLTTWCYCPNPLNNSCKILFEVEGRKKDRAVQGAKWGKHTRPEKGTRTTSNFHSAEPVRQRGQSTEAGKSQAQGGGCRLSQPPLLSRHRPGDTFHHLLSENRSSQTERFLPGNLGCVATETTTCKKARDWIWQRELQGQSLRLGQAQWSEKVYSLGWYIRS